ncbi:MAG: hypothetical protein K1X75_06005 [Leptospirales bacterium]|nr:hypothetical protein [Leptospirales bacterium]
MSDEKPLSAWRMWLFMHLPRCADITEIASRKLDRGAGFWESLQFRIHLSICIYCKRYYNQQRLLRRALRQAPAAPELAPEARQRIAAKLQKAIAESETN